MDTAECCETLFENWPESIPREGMLVTTFNEHVPFNGFLISGGILLVEAATSPTPTDPAK